MANVKGKSGREPTRSLPSTEPKLSTLTYSYFGPPVVNVYGTREEKQTWFGFDNSACKEFVENEKVNLNQIKERRERGILSIYI